MKKGCVKSKLIVSLILALFLSLSALAEQNIISSVVISKSKDKQNAYDLNIDSTDVVDYKINTKNDESVYFDLKNSSVSPELGTIYDDVNDIDNVIVKQIDKNKVRIYVNGKNAKNTELVFVNSLFETKNETQKKLIINRPINEYKPTHDLDDMENQEDIQDWDDNSFNFYHLLITIFSKLKEGPTAIVLTAVSLLFIIISMVKILSKKISQDSEPLIGLNTTRYKVIADEESPRQQTILNAQEELTKAHEKYKNYIQNKYKNSSASIPKNANIDSLKRTIALNQYQKSTKNPYTDQEVIKMKRDFEIKIPQTNSGNFQIPSVPRQTKTEFTSPYIQRKTNQINYTPKQSSGIENMKFLESVTKIYEQSGRADLADELKNSIIKAKQHI